MGWRTLLASPRDTSNEDVLSFVALWEKLWMESPATFPTILRRLLQEHYPADHKTTLDVVITTLLSFHPQFIASVLNVFIDMLVSQERSARRRGHATYSRNEIPFSAFLNMFLPSSERDPASAHRLTISCREILQHLHQRFLNMPSTSNKTSGEAHLCHWLADCLVEASSALREEHFQLLLDDCYRDLSTLPGHQGAAQRSLRLFRRFPESNLTLEAKLDKLRAVLLIEHTHYGKLSLAHTVVPLLLSLHQRLAREQATRDVDGADLVRRLLVPFAPVFLLYFSQPANVHSEKLLHQLLHSSAHPPHSVATVIALMDLLVAIFSSREHAEGPHAEAIHAALADAFHGKKQKYSLPSVEPWHWFRAHFLTPLLEALAEGQPQPVDDTEEFAGALTPVPRVAAVAETLLRRVFVNASYAHLLYGPTLEMEAHQSNAVQWENKRQQLVASFVGVLTAYGKSVEGQVAEMWEEAWRAAQPDPQPAVWAHRLKPLLASYPVLPPLFRRVAQHAFVAFLEQVLPEQPMLEDALLTAGLEVLERVLFFFLLESDPHVALGDEGKAKRSSDASRHHRDHGPRSTDGEQLVFVEPFLVLVRFISGRASTGRLPSTAYSRLQRYVARLLGILASNCACSTAFESGLVAHLSSPSYPFPSSATLSSVGTSGTGPSTPLATAAVTFPSPSVLVSPSTAYPTGPAAALVGYSFAKLSVFSATGASAQDVPLPESAPPGAVLMSPYQPKTGTRGFQPHHPGGGRRAAAAQQHHHKRDEEADVSNAAERLRQSTALLLHTLKRDRATTRDLESAMDVEATDSDVRFLQAALTRGRAMETAFRCLASSEDPSTREAILDLLAVLGHGAHHGLWSARSNVALLVALLHDRVPSVAAKAEPYVRDVLMAPDGCCDAQQLLQLMLDRIAETADPEHRREDSRLLTAMALLVAERASRSGTGEDGACLAQLVNRVDGLLFVKRDSARAPPASSSTSASSSSAPHPILIDLLAQLNGFLCAVPIHVDAGNRVLVPLDVLRRAMTCGGVQNCGSVVDDEEVRHQQLRLLSSSAVHAGRLLVDASTDDAARAYARACLAWVAEHIPLAVTGLSSTSEVVRDESVLVLQRLLAAPHNNGGAPDSPAIHQRIAAHLDAQLRSCLLASQSSAVAALRLALAALSPSLCLTSP